MPFVQIPDLKMHYEVAGEGETVLVFVHGYFASWRWWQSTLNQLPPGYRAYAPDLRGCGDSDRPADGYTIEQLADDLHHFATALELPPFHLVGHSLGGVAAMQFALDYPEHLRSLILVAPGPAEGMSVFYKNKRASYPLLLNLFEKRREASFELVGASYRFLRTLEANRPMLRRALRRMIPSIPQDDYFTALVDDAARMAPEAMIGYMQAVDAWQVQDELHRVDLPSIILWGDQDTLITEAAPLRRTAKGLRGRLVIWKGLGHAPQVEQPKRFVRFLKRFVDRRTKSTSAGPGWFEKLREKASDMVADLSERWQRSHRREVGSRKQEAVDSKQ